MDNLYNALSKKITYAKASTFPREQLYEVHGMINMARQLEAITAAEYLKLNHECVADGINNPQYF